MMPSGGMTNISGGIPTNVLGPRDPGAPQQSKRPAEASLYLAQNANLTKT